jgi:signal transduction histidine kinase
MGKLVRALDWSKTELGPLDGWPQSLRTIVSTCLSSRFPILIWWGPGLVMIYNDALAMIIGNKHPRALGQRGAQGWWEVWDLLGPMLMSVLDEGASTWSENQRLDIERTKTSEYLEETYFTFSYSPIRDESDGIGGVFCAVTETTAQVLSERRLMTLSAMAQQTADSATAGDACLRAACALGGNPADVPAAFIYLAQQDEQPRLAAVVGTFLVPPQLGRAAPAEWSIERVLSTGNLTLIEDDNVRPLLTAMGCTTTPIPKSLLFLPLGNVGIAGAPGVLVVGLAPLLLLDEQYRGFLMLVAGHTGTAIASARALESARQRAESLAQLDLAKTAFFSNISHEFRTPLTLMLGPTEDALARPSPSLQGADLDTVHRNGLRLLRLVNTLLDFSRIQAGRVDAAFEPTDLAALTKDFAGAFRSAIERAGLLFEVECESFETPVHVDRDMWEKIVLNLLSNALKFTFEGAITVTLHAADHMAVLGVRDTGVGVAASELSRLFERFHRVVGGRSRTHEGTGIGLALTRDLVHLHGGRIEVESTVGVGTRFVVSIPLGTSHLPADHVRSRGALAADGPRDKSFVTEALRWLSDPVGNTGSQGPANDVTVGARRTADARVLLVDDNADMRDYVARLLRQHWTVDTAADGEEALAMARESLPNLVLADIMMPKLDGFGLLRELRDDPKTRFVPVILLSARAGEDSRVEGLARGADDYLIKPFAAKELVARVATHLELGELRRRTQAERDRLHSLFDQSPAAIAVLRGPDFVFELCNPRYEALMQRRDLAGKSVAEAFPGLEAEPIRAILRNVFSTGTRFVGCDFPVKIRRDPAQQPQDAHFDFVYDPFFANDGTVDGIMVLAFDVTQRVESELQRERLLVEREGLLLSERNARADAERASLAKDEFLAMLGHELRNPLAPIVMTLDLLRRRDNDPAAREHAIIGRQVKHLVSLVDDLLDVSALTRGKIQLNRERIEISSLVERAIEVATPLIELRSHELFVQVPRTGLLVDVDATRIVQVLTNLLTNAAKYTDPYGEIRVSARAVKDELELCVVDNGIGISRDMLTHVFELFMQERQAIDRARGGLGLGLAIVENLMKMHAGTVSAASDGLGCGSTFMLRLPLVERASRTAFEALAAGVRKPQGPDSPRVLIVDDNVDAADMLGLAFQELGCQTRVAYDGAQALRMVESFGPGLALLDIGLPSMDGYELARRLRGGSTTARMRLVAVTGYGQKGDVEHALLAGFDEHFVKPVQFDKLPGMLARLKPDA